MRAPRTARFVPTAILTLAVLCGAPVRAADLVADADRGTGFLLRDDGSIARIDFFAGGRVETIHPAGDATPVAIAHARGGGTLYAIVPAPDGRETTLMTIGAPGTGSPAGAAVTLRGRGGMLEVTHDGRFACVAGLKPGARDRDDDRWTLTVVDLRSGEAAAPIPIGFEPKAMAIRGRDGVLARLFVAGKDRIATFTLSPPRASWFHLSPGVNRALALPDRTARVIVLRDEALAVIDPDRRDPAAARGPTGDDAVGAVALPGAGAGVAADPDGRTAVVLSSDGTEVFIVDVISAEIVERRPLHPPRDLIDAGSIARRPGGKDVLLLASSAPGSAGVAWEIDLPIEEDATEVAAARPAPAPPAPVPAGPKAADDGAGAKPPDTIALPSLPTGSAPAPETTRPIPETTKPSADPVAEKPAAADRAAPPKPPADPPRVEQKPATKMPNPEARPTQVAPPSPPTGSAPPPEAIKPTPEDAKPSAPDRPPTRQTPPDDPAPDKSAPKAAESVAEKPAASDRATPQIPADPSSADPKPATKTPAPEVRPTQVAPPSPPTGGAPPPEATRPIPEDAKPTAPDRPPTRQTPPDDPAPDKSAPKAAESVAEKPAASDRATPQKPPADPSSADPKPATKTPAPDGRPTQVAPPSPPIRSAPDATSPGSSPDLTETSSPAPGADPPEAPAIPAAPPAADPAAGSASPSGPPALSGTIRGEVGEGLEVIAYGPDNILKLHARAAVSADGRWSLALPPPGRYRLVVSGGPDRHVFTAPELRSVVITRPDAGIADLDFEIRGAL